MKERMIYWLAQAAKQAREDADRMLVHVAVELPVRESTISRFEKGENWPEDADETIGAYARDLEIPPRELWTRALKLWTTNDEPKSD